MARRQTIDPLVRAKVIETWGGECWLGLPGCTRVGTEDDHIVPYSHGGMDTVPNIRRACKHCNASRQDRVLYGYGARLHMIVAPPGSCDREAVDYIESHRNTGDPVVSFNAMASAMGLVSPSPAERRAVAMAWSGAYRQFAISAEPIDVWCVRTTPGTKRHPRMLDEWIALDYDVHVIDPGFGIEWERAGDDAARKMVRQWYALHLSQELVDARQRERRARLVALGLRTDRAQSPSRPEW
ncbi:HNH endonuclease [Bifidobacterium callitrichidarum]|uniref:HNH endonuclease n=1 Tax=Bifidobacterium callitrichidarum TaxID=2052941 RepID=A0A2U2N762_9BIFI|nr:HNH endonuclease [Bifidobacterium callitrichidarum]PWG65026.1 HNH endonuclease [Bifidobacterium callitrichidarum]